MKRPPSRRAAGSKPASKPTTPAKKGGAKPSTPRKAAPKPAKAKAAAKPSAPKPGAKPVRPANSQGRSKVAARKARPKPPPGTLLPPDKRTLALLGQGVSGSDYHGKIRGKAQGCDGKPALLVGGEVVSVGRVRGAIRREEIAAGIRPAPAKRVRATKVVDATDAAVEVVGAGSSGAKRAPTVALVVRESFGAGTPDAARAKAPAAALVKRESFGAGTPDARRGMTGWGPATVRVLERFQRPRALLTATGQESFRVAQNLLDDYAEIANGSLGARLAGSSDGTGTLKGRAYSNRYEFAEAVAREIEGRLHRPVPGDAQPLLARVSKLLGIDRRQGFTMDQREGRDRVWEEGDWYKTVAQLFARFGEVTGNTYYFNGVAMTRAEAERDEPMSALIGRIRERTIIIGEPWLLPGVDPLVMCKYNGGHATVGGRYVLLAGRNEWAHFVLSAMEKALKLAPAAKGPAFRQQFGSGSAEQGRPKPPASGKAPGGVRGQSWAALAATHTLRRAREEGEGRGRHFVVGEFELAPLDRLGAAAARPGARLSRASAEEFVDAVERQFADRARHQGFIIPLHADYVFSKRPDAGGATVYGRVETRGPGRNSVRVSDAEPVWARTKTVYPAAETWVLVNDPRVLHTALHDDAEHAQRQRRESFRAGSPDETRKPAPPAPVALVKRESFGPGSADAARPRRAPSGEWAELARTHDITTHATAPNAKGHRMHVAGRFDLYPRGGDPRQPVRTLSRAEAIAFVDAAVAFYAARPKYPNGRLIPVEGDAVYQQHSGFGGTGVTVHGTVYAGGKKSLRVRVTSVSSMLGGAKTASTYQLDPTWRVMGDPAGWRAMLDEDVRYQKVSDDMEGRRAAQADRYARSYDGAIARGEVPLTPDIATPGMIVHSHDYNPDYGLALGPQPKPYQITRVVGDDVYAVSLEPIEPSMAKMGKVHHEQKLRNGNLNMSEDSQRTHRGAPPALWMQTLYTAVVAQPRAIFRDPPAPEEARAGTTIDDRRERQRWLRNEVRNLHTEINARVSTGPYLALLRELGHIGNELESTTQGVATSTKLATVQRAVARIREEAAEEGRRISIDPARQSFNGPLVRPDTGSLRSLVTAADRYAATLPIVAEAGRIYQLLYAAEQSVVSGGGASKKAREALAAIAQVQHLYSPTKAPEVDTLIELWSDLVRASVMADAAADALKRARPAQGSALTSALVLLGLGDRDIPEYHNIRAWFALYADMLRRFADRIAMQSVGAPITVVDKTRKGAKYPSFSLKPGSAIVGVKAVESSADKPAEQVVLTVMQSEYSDTREPPAGAQWVADQIAQRILAWHRGVPAKPADPGVIDRVAALCGADKPPASANTEQAAAYLRHLVHAASEAVCYADGPRGGQPCGKRTYSRALSMPENPNGLGVRVSVEGPRSHSHMAEVWLWEDGTADVVEGGNRSPLAATQARTRHPSYASAIADVAARFEPMLVSTRKIRFGTGEADPMRASLSTFAMELGPNEAALLRRVVAVGAPLGGGLAIHVEQGSRWVRAECNVADFHGVMVMLESKAPAMQSAHFLVGVNPERLGWLRDAAPLAFHFKPGLATFVWGETRVDEVKTDPKLRPMAHMVAAIAAWLSVPAATLPGVFKRLAPLAFKDATGEYVALGLTPGGVKAAASNGISAVLLDLPDGGGRPPGKGVGGAVITPEVALSGRMQAVASLVAELLGPSGTVAVDTDGERHYFRAPRVVAWVSAGPSPWLGGRATLGGIAGMAAAGFKPAARREVRVPLKGLFAAFPVVKRLGPETCVTFADGRLYAEKHGNIVDIKLPVAMGPHAAPVAFIPETLEPVLRTLFPKVDPAAFVELHGTPDVDGAPGARFVPAPGALGLVMPCTTKATSAVPSADPGTAKSSDVSVVIPNDATGPLETMLSALGAPKGWMMHLGRVSLGTLRVTAGNRDGYFVADVPATFDGLWPSQSRVGVPGEAIAKVLRGKRDAGGVRIALMGKASDGAVDVRVSGRGLTLTGNAMPNDKLAGQILGDLASTQHVVASMTGAQAVDVFGAIEPSMSHDDTRPHLSAAFLNGVAAVATDGHRLLVAPYAKGGATMAGLVPARAVRLMLSVLGPKGTGRSVKITAAVHPSALASATVRRKPDAFIIDVGDLSLRTKAVDAEFPSYDQIIPSKWTGTLTVDREALVAFAAAMAKKYKNSRTQPIHFEADGRLVCTAGASDGDAPVVAPFKAKVEGAPVRIGFNANYLADAAAAMRGKTITLRHEGELDPVMIEENGRIAVCMPMRI